MHFIKFIALFVFGIALLLYLDACSGRKSSGHGVDALLEASTRLNNELDRCKAHAELFKWPKHKLWECERRAKWDYEHRTNPSR